MVTHKTAKAWFDCTVMAKKLGHTICNITWLYTHVYTHDNDKLVNLSLAELNTFGGVLRLTISRCSGPDIMPSLLLLLLLMLLKGGKSLSKVTASTSEFSLAKCVEFLIVQTSISSLSATMKCDITKFKI